MSIERLVALQASINELKLKRERYIELLVDVQKDIVRLTEEYVRVENEK